MGWLWDHFHSVEISFALPLAGFVATTIYGSPYPRLFSENEALRSHERTVSRPHARCDF